MKQSHQMEANYTKAHREKLQKQRKAYFSGQHKSFEIERHKSKVTALKTRGQPKIHLEALSPVSRKSFGDAVSRKSLSELSRKSMGDLPANHGAWGKRSNFLSNMSNSSTASSISRRSFSMDRARPGMRASMEKVRNLQGQVKDVTNKAVVYTRKE